MNALLHCYKKDQYVGEKKVMNRKDNLNIHAFMQICSMGLNKHCCFRFSRWF